MVNPALIAPAFARDSDIYLTTPAGTSTAEPNVLFILGTNDRMNIAEAWREYDPVTYDSHAEYLWNDLAIINTAEVVAENVDMISTAAPPVNPFSAWGTWSGALNTDRRALWQATLAYAQGTQAGDPGPRSVYRNYWLGLMALLGAYRHADDQPAAVVGIVQPLSRLHTNRTRRTRRRHFSACHDPELYRHQ
jgi:hypothetical protein